MGIYRKFTEISRKLLQIQWKKGRKFSGFETQLPLLKKMVTGIKCTARMVAQISGQQFPRLSRLRYSNLLVDRTSQMNSWHQHAQERTRLLRFLTKYFEETSGRARDPRSHAQLLAEFRCQLNELERRTPQVFWRFGTVQRLVSSVFAKVRAI